MTLVNDKALTYLDGICYVKPGIPFIAVPTTAGTGSEITNNAVLIDNTKGIKKSIRGTQLIAKYILNRDWMSG